MDVRTGEVIVKNEKLTQELMDRSNIANLPFRVINAPDDFQKQVEMGYIIPLNRLPKRGCKRCFGRGHTGKNTQTGLYTPCSCVL